MQKKSYKHNNSNELEENAHAHTHARLQEKILENLVELQKVHTNLAERFDKLSNQIAGLLNLFETAAQTFAKNPANMVTEKDKEFLEKIDKLLDQNKTIAKGLTLMEERIREKVYGMPKSQEFAEKRDEDEYEPSTLQGISKF